MFAAGAFSGADLSRIRVFTLDDWNDARSVVARVIPGRNNWMQAAQDLAAAIALHLLYSGLDVVDFRAIRAFVSDDAEAVERRLRAALAGRSGEPHPFVTHHFRGHLRREPVYARAVEIAITSTASFEPVYIPGL